MSSARNFSGFSWEKIRKLATHNWRTKLACLLVASTIWLIIKRHVGSGVVRLELPIPPAALKAP